MRGWAAVVGYAIVALLIASVLLERNSSSESGQVESVPAAAAGLGGHDRQSALPASLADPSNSVEVGRFVLASPAPRESPAPTAPAVGNNTLQGASAAPHCDVNSDLTLALSDEAARLLLPGANGSAVFRGLDGAKHHANLARVLLGNARHANANANATAARQSGVPPGMCAFLLAVAGRGPCEGRRRADAAGGGAHNASSPLVPRVLVFGGSMTFGTEPMKRVRRSCPGCPPASSLANVEGRIFGDAPHCCSWPRFVQRWLDTVAASAASGGGPHRGARAAEIVNLAVPASSTGWLAPQVRHILSSLQGGPPTQCDLVVLDYSVNDADAKVLYQDNETKLAEALATVVAKVAPAPVLVLQTYPHAGRKDRGGKRVPAKSFDYRRAYRAAVKGQRATLHDVTTVLETNPRDAAVGRGVLWPHPPWEQHAILARLVCSSLARAMSAAVACGGGGSSGSACAARVAIDPTATTVAGAGDPSLAATDYGDCDTTDAVWADAKVAHGRKGKARGVAIELGAGWLLFEDRPGKPGWIFDSSGKRGSGGESSVASFQIGQEWAPWLAYGLRPVRVHVSFLKTYDDSAATIEVMYCGRSLLSVDTRWSGRISLVVTDSAVAPPCRSLSSVGRVDVACKATANGRGTKRRSKCKIVSVALCAAAGNA